VAYFKISLQLVDGTEEDVVRMAGKPIEIRTVYFPDTSID
jgi:hypothetical protein